MLADKFPSLSHAPLSEYNRSLFLARLSDESSAGVRVGGGFFNSVGLLVINVVRYRYVLLGRTVSRKF